MANLEQFLFWWAAISTASAIGSFWLWWRAKNTIKKLEYSAGHDGLTGFLRKEILPEKYLAVLAQVSRSVSWSMMVVDIDHFKQINDKNGHSTGDKVLKELADVIKDNLREVDFVFRYGGEEFLILALGDQDEVIRGAERIRTAVTTRTPMIDLPVTVSIGVTQIVEGEPSLTAFNRADKALYRAKEEGRNQVVAL